MNQVVPNVGEVDATLDENSALGPPGRMADRKLSVIKQQEAARAMLEKARVAVGKDRVRAEGSTAANARHAACGGIRGACSWAACGLKMHGACRWCLSAILAPSLCHAGVLMPDDHATITYRVLAMQPC